MIPRPQSSSLRWAEVWRAFQWRERSEMPKLTFIVLSFGLFGSLACNQIADIHDPIPQGGPATTPATTGSAPGTTASGAPSTPSSTPSSGGDPSNFLGKWSGTGTISYTNCTLSSDNGSVQGGGAMT